LYAVRGCGFNPADCADSDNPGFRLHRQLISSLCYWNCVFWGIL
jgi:hypothetical protein